MEELILAILNQEYLTNSGKTGLGPINASDFIQISNKLKTILSANNYLSKT
jgi:hypothetical protein